MLKQIKGSLSTLSFHDCDALAEEKINQAKSEFVTLASHQLRTPISAIKWLTELLLQNDVGSLTDNQRECIKKIYSSNVRLTAIVDDLLLASSLEAHSVPVRPEEVNLPNLCRRVIADQLHIQEEQKDLQISQNYGSGLDRVLLDPSLMKIILRTLFSNAIKYTPPGGHIAINLQIKKQDTISLSVKDSGYGIPKEEQQNIFVKLYRATNIKDQDTDGTGLGLYIAKELLKQLGGTITFISKENVGSTFTVGLPLSGMKRHEVTNG